MSIETLQEITVCMHGPTSQYTCIEAQQNDTSSRRVRVNLLGFNNKKYTVPPDCVAVLYVKKLDGHEVFDKCEVEESGSLIVTLKGQTVSCSGRQRAQIYIVSADGASDIKSQVFYLNVERAAYSEDAIESTDEYGVLRELIQSNQAIAESELLRVSAEAERIANEEIRIANEEERTNAETERNKAIEQVIKATEEIAESAKHHASAIVNAAFGESIVVTDSADGEVQGLKVFGRTEQFTTTGKNLFNPENVIGAFLDTATTMVQALAPCTSVYIECEPDTTYAISKKAGTRFAAAYTTVIPADDVPYFSLKDRGEQSSMDYTTGADAKYLVAYVHHTERDANITAEEMLASVQIEKGSVATEYEPYTGGIPSPNPQYPQELVSVGDDGDVEVEVYGANLDVALEQGTFGVLPGEAINATGWADATRLKSSLLTNRNYYITSSESGYQVYAVVGDDVVANYENSKWNNLPYHHISNERENARFIFRKSDNSALTPDTPIMFSFADVDYELPKELRSITASTPNGLPAIPVTGASLATYTDADGQMWCADEVDFERGVYVQRVKRIGVTGNLIDQYNSYEQFARITLADMYSTNSRRTEVMSNYFTFSANTKIEGTTFAYLNDVRFYKTFTDLNEAKTWFDSNAVDAIYILATPIETPLSDEELASYKALHTNYPVTTVLNDASAYMELEYNADTKNYIDNKFTEIQNAILSIGGNV